MPQTLPEFIFYAFIACSSILIFYYLYFFSRLAFYKEKHTALTRRLPATIIVCGRNELYNFEKNIPELLKQEYDFSFEVLVVNDNSTDDSKPILNWMSWNNPLLNVINLEREAEIYSGKKYPLSIGIKESKNELLVLTDADCKPASDQWLNKMTEKFSDQIGIVLGYGAYEKHSGLLNKLIRFETFHSALQYTTYALAGLPYMGVGRNLSYKKELFFKHKGFVSISHIPGGDDDLFISKAATKKNTGIVINKEAHTISVPKKSWKEWKSQKTRHYSTSKYYQPKHKFLLGLYSLSQWLFYPLLLLAAFLFSWKIALGLFVVKSILMFFIFSKSMKKLNESDLIPWIFFMDFWMLFYYLIFAGTIFKKADRKW